MGIKKLFVRFQNADYFSRFAEFQNLVTENEKFCSIKLETLAMEEA